MYHVLNRGVARLALFEKDADYEAFERVMSEAMVEFPTRLLSYCLMPNHWHMVIWPRKEGELTDIVKWLTYTHLMRWHAHYERVKGSKRGRKGSTKGVQREYKGVKARE